MATSRFRFCLARRCIVAAIAFGATQLLCAPATAQDAAPLGQSELEQLVAPIAPSPAYQPFCWEPPGREQRLVFRSRRDMPAAILRTYA